MRIHTIKNIRLTVFLLLIATVHSIGDAQSLKQKLQDQLDSTLSEHAIPGATLGVVLGDGTRLSLASGFEDKESKTKMRPDSRMFCGSTGKTFVSAVVLQLVEEKKIKLSDLAKKFFEPSKTNWFQELPNSKTMTIESLLNHTSGLPRYIFQREFLNDLKSNPLKSRKPVECLSVLRKKTATHEVGQGWSYSDSNYLVLGLVIEKVTGKSFYQNVAERMLKPLKLTNTIPATQPKLEGLSQGYIGRMNPFGMPNKTVSKGSYALNPEFEWCGGGFITTSSDLAIWMHALHHDNVLKKDSHRDLVTPAPFPTRLSGKAKYGLGSFVWETSNGKFFGHEGVMPGYLTQIEFSKKHGFSIAFQSNTDEGFGRNHHAIVQNLASIIIEHK